MTRKTLLLPLLKNLQSRIHPEKAKLVATGNLEIRNPIQKNQPQKIRKLQKGTIRNLENRTSLIPTTGRTIKEAKTIIVTITALIATTATIIAMITATITAATRKTILIITATPMATATTATATASQIMSSMPL